MHRRWLSLPLITSTVSAFYPYHDEQGENNEKRFIPLHPFSKESQDDLITVDIKKVYHKRDNVFNVVTSTQPSSPNGLAINQDGADYSYFSTMNFGSKGQAMYMLIDTGSANTWVMGQNCSSKSCSLHNLFGPEDSTTLNVTTKQWSLAYGTGSVSGIVATDTVKFANFSLSMGFGLANTASDDFNSYPMDGILGLGRVASNELGVPTIMDNLKTQGKMNQNVLGVHLTREAANVNDGEIVFGGVNQAKYTGQIGYTKTSSTSAWEIPVDDVFVNGTPCNLTGKSAIIDTGTSYILMPPSDAKAVHSLISGSINSSETYTVPCDSTANVQVSFSGTKYSISPKDYVGKSTSGNNCGSNIVGHQAFGANEWILGDVFLKNVYSVFDFDQAQIGFALSAPSESNPSSTTTTIASTTGSSTTLVTSTTAPTGTKTSTASSSSTSSSANNGNPFDASSSSPSKSAANSIAQNHSLVLMMMAAFLAGLIV